MSNVSQTLACLLVAAPAFLCRGDVSLSKHNALDDVAEAFAIIESVHPNPYTVASREQIARSRAALESRLAETQNRTELFLGLAPIIASMRDGHTSLRLPMGDFEDRFGDAVFPIDVTFVESSLFVKRDFSGKLPVGAEITQIGGRSVSDIVDRLQRLQHAELLPARRQNIAKYFPAYLALELEMKSPFEVHYKLTAKPGSEKVARSKRISGLAASKLRKKRSQVESLSPYDYSPFPNSKLGLISYNVCAPGPRFDAFLQTTFEQIERSRLDALVIDVRKNGGGSARANVALFDYITDKPYRMVSGGEVKVSALVKKKVGREAFENRFAPWDTPDGTVVSEDDVPLREPRKNPLRYKGPVYVLTGVGTQSSALNFAAAVKDYKLATIVGQETGDPATAFGDLEVFRLKRSGLELYVSTKFFVRPSGDRKRRGVVPDFEIKRTLQDRGEFHDSAIEFVKRHVGQVDQ